MAEEGRPDQRPDEPPDDDLRALLEVGPLDEVTRRRLVDRAMAETAPVAPRARHRRLLVAAAVAALLIAGGVAIVANGSHHDSTTAAPTARTPAARGPAKAAAPESGASATSGDAALAPVAPQDYGDLGDLARPVTLRTPVPDSTRVDALLRSVDAASCRSALPTGTVVGVATGRLAGRDAVVVATELPDGTRSLDAIVLDPCSVTPVG